MAQSSNDIRLADAAGVNHAKINTGGDMAVSLSSPGAVAAGVFAQLNPYGAQRVSVEPTMLFYDPFDGSTLDTANRWTATGTQLPAQSGTGYVAIQPTTGALATNTSILTSQPVFDSPGLGFSVIACTVTLEATQVTSNLNTHRFWGKGQVTTYAYATPVTDGYGFEVDGTTGALQCVVYQGGVKYVIHSTTQANISSSIVGLGGSATALPTGTSGTNYGQPLTWKGGVHRYAVFARTDVIYWFIEGQELPIAALSYLSSNVQGLPLRFASITNSAAASAANTFQLNGIAVHDSTAQNHTISDPTYAWRRAQVGKSGGLSVKGAPISTQALAVTAGTPVTGASVDVSEAGNISFIVKNTVAGTPYTGNPVVVFEQSDDGVSWAPLQVVSTIAYAAPYTGTVTLPAGVANVEYVFDAGLEGVNWARVRVTTAPTANGMTIVSSPGGLAFEPTVGVLNVAQPATTMQTATAAISTAATLTTPTPTNGQFVYLTALTVQLYAGGAITGTATPIVVSTTNLGAGSGVSTFTFPTANAIGTTNLQQFTFSPPLKGAAANTAVVISAPLTTSVIWRITATYYIAP